MREKVINRCRPAKPKGFATIGWKNPYNVLEHRLSEVYFLFRSGSVPLPGYKITPLMRTDVSRRKAKEKRVRRFCVLDGFGYLA